VFTGGAPLAAVDAVCGVDDADELLASLVDKSLVERDGGRYRMLETIRLFCARKLADTDEQELRLAHARYHLALARRADPHLRRAEQLDWLATLAAEHGNLMAALRWAVQEDRATAFELVAALAAYWWLSGRRSQAGDAASALLSGPVPDGLTEEYVSCVVHAVPRAAPEHWARAARIMRMADGALRYPFGVALWGMTAGPPDGSPADRLPDADPWSIALRGLSDGLMLVLNGRPADGERTLAEVLTLFRDVGERWGTAQALDWLGQVASWRGEWRRAHELWTEGLALLAQLGALEECADMLCHRAESFVRQGDLDAATADYQRAAELNAKAGLPDMPAEARLGFGEIARLRGDVDTAREQLDRALAASQDDDFTTAATRSRVLTSLGRLAEASGDQATALARHREALAAARTSPLVSVLADAVAGQAGAALLAGSGEQAALLLGAAVALRGTAITGDVDVARIAGQVGTEAFAAAYARGAAMTREQALTVADSVAG
jgi:tetratricopeptide (TPR) repeat protein